jgi:phytoene dehydrogenase-like protein
LRTAESWPHSPRPTSAYDWLKGVDDEYDVIVIGSGLGGLTGANVLAKAGHRVLLLEHHYQFGGLATWFTRKGGHIFDISLHGFPIGMIKSCRKYWTKEIADRIVQLKDVRFVNPQMDVWTTFTREDYTRVLVEKFGVPTEKAEAFYEHLRAMNYYDNNPETTGEMLNRFFPGQARRAAAADGADLLCQRIRFQRSRDHLWHRVFELHGRGSLHLPRRFRPAGRKDD